MCDTWHETRCQTCRRAASATLVERFMKREERNSKTVLFRSPFPDLMSKHIRDAVFCWLKFAIMHVLPFPIIMLKAVHEKRKPRAVDESETMMLMIVLQINSSYFDRWFPQLNNCPFERQLAKARRRPSSNCSVGFDRQAL